MFMLTPPQPWPTRWEPLVSDQVAALVWTLVVVILVGVVLIVLMRAVM